MTPALASPSSNEPCRSPKGWHSNVAVALFVAFLSVPPMKIPAPRVPSVNIVTGENEKRSYCCLLLFATLQLQQPVMTCYFSLSCFPSLSQVMTFFCQCVCFFCFQLNENSPPPFGLCDFFLARDTLFVSDFTIYCVMCSKFPSFVLQIILSMNWQ